MPQEKGIKQKENVKYLLFWDDYAMNSYLYGTSLSFTDSGCVVFDNKLMPSGQIIKSWKVQLNYQGDRTEPYLPILIEGARYRLTPFIKTEPENSVLIRLDFYGRQSDSKGYIILDSDGGEFEYPYGAYSYRLQLVQGGSERMIFHNIMIEEISEKDEMDYRVLNPDAKSEILHIILPRMTGRMLIYPPLDSLPDLTNILMAPPMLMQPPEFFEPDWIQDKCRQLGLSIIHFYAWDPRGCLIAQKLLKQYRGSRFGKVVPGTGSGKATVDM